MATLNELLRALPLDCAVLAGAVGLGREVRRILRIQPTGDLIVSVGTGDLVVYLVADQSPDTGKVADRALSALLCSGVAGLVTDAVPGVSVVQLADKCGAPVLSIQQKVEGKQLYEALDRRLELLRSRLLTQRQDLERDLSDLARAGAAPAMILERLVEMTRKTGLLQGPNALVEHIQPTAQHALEPALVRQAIRETDAAAQRWMLENADPTVANVLYLELPAQGLVRLMSPVWIEGRVDAAVSLLTPAAELTARDRYGLLAAARAIGMTSIETKVDSRVTFVGRSCGPVAAIVLRATGASLDALGEAVRRQIDLTQGGLRLGREDVRVWLAYDSADHWHRCVSDWHAHLSKEIGGLSIGHYLHRRSTDLADSNYAVMQAAEAAVVGERLFGPGHVTSYADAQLAKFLLARYGAAELGSLYERAVGKLAVEDLKQDGDLVSTLEVDCETFGIKRTAERRGVHRNTVR